MVAADDALRRALHVPAVDVAEPANRLAVLHWLQNLVGDGHVRWNLPEAVRAAQLRPAELRRLSRFWDEEGPASLTRRIGELLGALGRTGRQVLLVAGRDGQRLHWSIACDEPTGSLAPAVRAALPGAVMDERADHEPLRSALALPGRLALVGVPRRVVAPREKPLLERLAVCDVPRWALVVHARPAPARALVERFQQVSSLRRQLAAHARATRSVTETETREDVDPVAELAADLLRREERRSLRTTRLTGLVVDAWLLGDEEGLASLGAIAAATLAADDALTPRPLRTLPDGGRDASATLLLPEELAAIVAPPSHDVRGFEVRRWDRFDVEAESVHDSQGPTLRLGESAAGDTIAYPADALTSHTLVSGATGSGKSSLVRSLLDQLRTPEISVPWLVVEPTKDEYATLPVGDLAVWRIGDPSDRSWRLNPLEVPARIPVQTHIDLLIALFESTFALFPPLPSIIEMGLRQVYRERGWDLPSGRNAQLEADPDHPGFPTLADLQTVCLDLVDELGYAGEVLHNVRGALHARLGSLLDGPKGVLIDTDEPFDVDRLLNGPCVVNLDLVGSDREKAFFMGLLLVRLWEARRGHRCRQLRHLTVLEEAHRILPAAESAAGGDFAAETFTNLLAEVRAAGEGIVVAEQSPSRLASTAIANTGLKVALRSMGADDRDVLGPALNLDEDQPRALTSLDAHEGLVFWAGMDQPVRMRAAASPCPEGGPQPTAATAAAPAPPVVDDRRVARLADLLLRVDVDEAAAVRAALRQRLAIVLPPVLADRVEDAALRAVRSAAERLGRARALPSTTRLQMVEGALAEPPAGTVLAHAEDGCRCDDSGPAAACPLRELVADCLADWRAEGREPAEIARLTAPVDAAAHLRLRLVETIGTDQAPRSLRQGVGCLARHALAGTRPQAEIRAFVADVVEAVRP